MGAARWTPDYRSVLIDVAVAACMLGYGSAIMLRHTYGPTWLPWVSIMVAAGLVGLGRRFPEPSLVGLLALRVWEWWTGNWQGSTQMAQFIVVFYLAGRRRPWAGPAGAVAAVAVMLATGTSDPLTAAQLVSTLGFFGVALGCGLALGFERERRVTASSRAERVRVEAEHRRVEAVQAERLRLRDDLHDVVGHHLTLGLVMAEEADLARERDPERLPDLLDAIADNARDALEEMDRATSWLGSGAVGSGALGSGAVGSAAPDAGSADAGAALRPTAILADLGASSPPPAGPGWMCDWCGTTGTSS